MSLLSGLSTVVTNVQKFLTSPGIKTAETIASFIPAATPVATLASIASDVAGAKSFGEAAEKLLAYTPPGMVMKAFEPIIKLTGAGPALTYGSQLTGQMQPYIYNYGQIQTSPAIQTIPTANQYGGVTQGGDLQAYAQYERGRMSQWNTYYQDLVQYFKQTARNAVMQALT